MRRELFAFLRMLKLSPLSWHEEIHTLHKFLPQAQVQEMLRGAQAIVILITEDDEAELATSEFQFAQPEPSLSPTQLLNLAGEQARHSGRMILLGMGQVRDRWAEADSPLILLNNKMAPRWQLMLRLEDAGCLVQRPENELLREIGNFSFTPHLHKQGEP
jgi:hypothetical protein